ncbi:arrestin homolog [Lepeophtheirus salmonis]|uniref:arrestin homolog n=1 Tax=Lepeophtheirus salmonis TaxID=72036 RepID=UPI001AE45CBF|nr:arrestin homolog [Lepeophtheirus salmonis]
MVVFFLYLGRREYVSCDGKMDPVEGVAHICDNKDYIEGKTLFASLVCTFRHGREEDEVMGVSFKKELIVDRCEIPTSNNTDDLTKLQSRLTRKLGDMAFPFILNFPEIAPNSVLIRGDEGDASQMGVNYEVRVHIGDGPSDFKGTKKSSVSMSIRKTQWVGVPNEKRCPTATADKGFLCSKGKIVLECKLDNEIVYHGQDIPINVSIHNNSNKSVKSIKCVIVQHCEMTLVQAQYSCKVARLETKDGCPLGPGASMNRTFTMKPLSQMCGCERGLALDAALSKVTDETNLASSSIAESGDPNDLLGVIVSYSIKVKLVLSGMGGELEVDVPFKLLHPRPESEEADKLQELKKETAKTVQSNKRRQKFQAQDSVLVDTFGTSQEE